MESVLDRGQSLKQCMLRLGRLQGDICPSASNASASNSSASNASASNSSKNHQLRNHVRATFSSPLDCDSQAGWSYGAIIII